MKALTVLQPWATALISGAKTIETRDWVTSHRGPLLIHASSRCLSGALRRFDEGLPHGVVLGGVWLERIEDSNKRTAPLDLRPFYGLIDGRYYWHVRPLFALSSPIPWRGRQGLWDFPDHILPDECPQQEKMVH